MKNEYLEALKTARISGDIRLPFKPEYKGCVYRNAAEEDKYLILWLMRRPKRIRFELFEDKDFKKTEKIIEIELKDLKELSEKIVAIGEYYEDSLHLAEDLTCLFMTL